MQKVREYFGDVFKLEQPAELNRHVDPSIPLTWAHRWERFRLTLPFIFAGSFLVAAQGLFVIWLEEAWERIPVFGVALLAYPLIFLGLMEFWIRQEQRRKRILEFRNNKVVFGGRWFWAPGGERTRISS